MQKLISNLHFDLYQMTRPFSHKAQTIWLLQTTNPQGPTKSTSLNPLPGIGECQPDVQARAQAPLPLRNGHIVGHIGLKQSLWHAIVSNMLTVCLCYRPGAIQKNWWKNDDDDDDKWWWRWQWLISSLITIDDDDNDAKRHWNSDDVLMTLWLYR